MTMPPSQIQITHEIVDLTLHMKKQYMDADTKRFDLVKIAFNHMVHEGRCAWSREELAKRPVELADAVLAEMDKSPATPVTAAAILPLIRQRLQNELADQRATHEKYPVGDESLQQFRTGAEHGLKRAMAIVAAMDPTPDTGPPAEEIAPLANDVLTGLEEPALSRLRASIQDQLDVDLEANANIPTTNLRVGGYRDGSCDARKSTLALIDAAIGKAGETENDNAK